MWKSGQVPKKSGIRVSTRERSGRVPGKGKIWVSAGKVESGRVLKKGLGEYREMVESRRVLEKVNPGEYRRRVESWRVPKK